MTEPTPASRSWIPPFSEVLALAAAGAAAFHGDPLTAGAGFLGAGMSIATRWVWLRTPAIDSLRILEASALLAASLGLGGAAYFWAKPWLLPAALLAVPGAGLVLGAARLFIRARKRLETIVFEPLTPRRQTTLLAVDTIALNKTGTLTFGRLEVTRVSPMAGVSEEELIEAVISAPRPRVPDAVARALADLASGRGICARSDGSESLLAGPREELEAAGIKLPKAGYAREGTTIWGARDGRCIGSLAVDDVLRPEVRHAIALFHGMKLRTVMLSEDDISSTRYIGWRSSVSASYGNLSASDRIAKVSELRKAGRNVAVIGDESSDPELLSVADVAILMGSGAAPLKETVTLREKNLQSLADAFRVLRSCRLGTRLLAPAALLLGACGGLLVLTGLIPPVAGPIWGILCAALLAWAGGMVRS